MKKLFSHLKKPVFANDLLGLLVVYVLIIWASYFVIVLIGLRPESHRIAVLTTHWIFGCIISIFILCRLRIGVDFGRLNKRVDITLTFLSWFSAFFIFLTAVIPAVPIVFIFALVFLFKKIAQILQYIPSTIASVLSKGLIFVLGLKQKNIFGEIPLKGVYILLYTHKGSADYFLWAADLIFRLWKIVAGTNLLKFPVFGLFLKMFAILSQRGSLKSAKEVHNESVACLSSGVFVGRAGEPGRFRPGTKNKNNKTYRFIGEFANGAFKLSVQTGVPIIPISYMFSGDYKEPMKEKMPKSMTDILAWIYFLRNYRWFNQVNEIWRIVLPEFLPEGSGTGYSEEERVRRLKKRVRNALIKNEAYWWGVKNRKIPYPERPHMV